jgi:hypothetical protein
MKRTALFLFLGLFSSFIAAQDIILTLEGDEIKAKIQEISDDIIKYKEYDFLDGPLRNILVSDVFMIIYENGRRESFSSQSTRVTTGPAQQETTRRVQEAPPPKKGYKGNYFMLGVGYGNSYGGAGICAQMRLGGNVGFGLHAGVGYFPDAPVLAAGGVKFFPFRGIYINAQFGLTGHEYWYEYSYSSYYGSSYDSGEQLLYGPSFLAGVDWTWGRKIGYGFNAALGLTYNVNVVNFSPVTLALDIGYVMRF